MFALSTVCATAQGTRQWTTARFEEFERGTPSGVALRNDGRVEVAPALTTVATVPATFLWSIAASGNDVYVGTGAASGGSQLTRIDSKGAITTAATFKELNVQSVVALPGGDLLAATSPDGKVYRVSNGAAKVIFDPSATAEKPKYLWALALTPDGDVLVAAGAPAVLYRISLREAVAKPAVVFRSGDQHLRCLAVGRDGTVYVGSDGAGIIYRISNGKAFALYAAPRHEITSLALDTDGSVYAAGVGDRRPPSLPPLPAGGAPQIPLNFAQPGSSLSTNNNSVVPEGSEIYSISPAGLPRRLVALRDDVVYGLALRNGSLYAASGNRGRIYRVDTSSAGLYTDVAHVEAGQATGMIPLPDGLAIATSNGGKVLKLADAASREASLTSDVFDGEIATRWGRAELRGSGASTFYVRSGNIENPRDGFADLWSPWTPVKANETPLPVPTARYLQWKLVLQPGADVRAVTVNYLPQNLPPQIDDLVVQPGARVAAGFVPSSAPTIPIAFRSVPSVAITPLDATPPPIQAQRDRNAVTARWLARDPNNDDLTFTLDYRDVREATWHRLRDKITERVLTFDARLLPDADYELRVTASDSPVHPDSEALTGERISAPFTVDTTPPVPGALTASVIGNQLHAMLDVRDATSPIARAEYSLDAGAWQYLEPVGHLSDSPTEHYDFTVPVTGAGEHTIAVRVFDRNENAVSVKAFTH